MVGENSSDILSGIKAWHKFYQKGTNAWPTCEFKNIPEMLRYSAQAYADKRAFTICLPNGLSSSLTYAEVDKYSNYFASYLRDTLGLQPGDKVAVQLPNCLAWPICVFGVFKAQCLLVAMNPQSTAYEMQQILNDSEATAIITLNLFQEKLDELLKQTQLKHVVIAKISEFYPIWQRTLINIVTNFQNPVKPTAVKFRSFRRSLKHGKTGSFKANYDIDLQNCPAMLQYTGGTTGVTKAAVLTHQNILMNITQISEFLHKDLKKGCETVLAALPLYHIFAFTAVAMLFYKVGGNNILIPNPRPIGNLKQAFKKFNFTWIPGVNTLFNALNNETWFTHNPPKNANTIAGGTALHNAVAEKWKSIVGRIILEGYGLTECSPVVTFNPMGGQDRLGTIGIPLPGTLVEIRDDTGRVCNVSEIGELFVYGAQVMQGYWKRSEDNKKVLQQGWLATGDMGYMDSDGFITLVDRKKDLILVSGFNVYPNEVEDCISKHANVREVAVVGVPDNNTGEQVQAFIVVKEGNISEQELRAHCKIYLTNYKIPKRFVFLRDLPKSNVGKILRREVRALALARTPEQK